MMAVESNNASDCFTLYKGSRHPFILPLTCVTPQQAFCGKLKFYAEPTSANKKVERERKFGIHKHTRNNFEMTVLTILFIQPPFHSFVFCNSVLTFELYLGSI